MTLSQSSCWQTGSVLLTFEISNTDLAVSSKINRPIKLTKNPIELLLTYHSLAASQNARREGATEIGHWHLLQSFPGLWKRLCFKQLWKSRNLTHSRPVSVPVFSTDSHLEGESENVCNMIATQIIIMIVELMPVAQDLRCTPQS